MNSNQTQSQALLGRYLDAHGVPIDGGPSIERALPQLGARPPAVDEQPPSLLETGIKVVDLFAPIVRGGAIALVAGAGVGKTVLMEELIERVASRRGGCAVLASLDDDSFNKQDVIAELRGSGVEPHTVSVLGRRDEPPGTPERVARLGLALAEDLCAGGRETLLFLDELLVTFETIERLRTRLRGRPDAALTLFVLQHKTPLEGENALLDQLLGERDGRLVFSRALGQQNIWPAVDPLRSASRLLEAGLVSAEHLRVAGAARELLRAGGVAAGAGDPSAPHYGRARHVLNFLAQPFVVAEQYTATPGEYVPLAETIRGFGGLVDGAYDAVPEQAFHFVGPIEQALAKAGSAASA